MKIMSVVGARPNFMKVAPIISAINGRNAELAAAGDMPIHHVLVHTGQHYDRLMSDSFFADLNLPKPDVHLGVGSGSHAVQTAEILRKFEGVLLQEKPDFLIVVGDVNSTIACALVASKISFDTAGTRPRIVHVESGLRSFDRSMPEEVNRILTDQLSDLLFVTEESGVRNLAREGVPLEKVHFVGNTMIDSLLACQERAEASTILDDLGLRKEVSGDGSNRLIEPYALLTLHRPANVDDGVAFTNILDGLEDLATECPIIFPAHPRTQKRVKELGLEPYFESRYVQRRTQGLPVAARRGSIRMVEPLGYLDFLCLMKRARVVVTDSGGIQEETTCLGVPCVTVRENTERPVTLERGTNVLAGVQKEGIKDAVRRQLCRTFTNRIPENWDGRSATKIVELVVSEYKALQDLKKNERDTLLA